MAGLNFGTAAPTLLSGMGGEQPQQEPEQEPDEEEAEGAQGKKIIDPKTGTPMFLMPNGDLVIGMKTGPYAPEEGSDDFDSNLAELIDQSKRSTLAAELYQLYQSDTQSRREYMQTLADGMSLLGLVLEKPVSSSADASAPVEGMSTERSHLLLEAVIRGQSNASAELLPADGPVKVVDDGPETIDREIAAEDLEKAMNHYLKPGGIATEYYPDTERLLWRAFYGGCCFRKVYRCPLRERPVAESVPAENLIINWGASDLTNAARVTHRQPMQSHLVKSMQRLKVWRDCTLSQPATNPTPTEREEAKLEGKSEAPQLPSDYPHIILEMYVDMDLKEYGIPNRGQKDGRPVPYRVVLEENSREILEIRRVWEEEDELFRKRKMFVKYPIIPGFGFYDYGFVHILGNDTQALTAMLRMTLDSGMFQNFPGYLYSSMAGRQDTDVFRIPPGGGRAIDTAGAPIGDIVLPLPFKGPSSALVEMMGKIQSDAQRLGGTAELPVGEGKQDAPVGTTIALIEQATKVVASVHKRLHTAQAEEFQLLKKLFQEDPEALWRGIEDSPLYKDGQPPEAESVIAALGDFRISPQADPNVPSHMHRIMLAMSVAQLALNNPLYDQEEVQKYLLGVLGAPEQLLKDPNQQQQQGQDPEQMKNAAEAQLKSRELDIKGQELQQKTQQIVLAGQQKLQGLNLTAQNRQRDDMMRLRELGIESQDRAADRESRERVANLHAALDLRQHNDQMAGEALKHGTDTHTERTGQVMQHLQAMREPKPGTAGLAP